MITGQFRQLRVYPHHHSSTGRCRGRLDTFLKLDFRHDFIFTHMKHVIRTTGLTTVVRIRLSEISREKTWQRQRGRSSSDVYDMQASSFAGHFFNDGPEKRPETDAVSPTRKQSETHARASARVTGCWSRSRSARCCRRPSSSSNRENIITVDEPVRAARVWALGTI